MWWMSYVIGITTIICSELIIQRKWYGYICHLFNQVLWLIFIVSSGQYGLLPLNVFLTIQYSRGLVIWLRYQEKQKHAATHRVSDETPPSESSRPDTGH